MKECTKRFDVYKGRLGLVDCLEGALVRRVDGWSSRKLEDGFGWGWVLRQAV